MGSRITGQKKLLPVVVVEERTFLTIERQKIPDAHGFFKKKSLIKFKDFQMLNAMKINF